MTIIGDSQLNRLDGGKLNNNKRKVELKTKGGMKKKDLVEKVGIPESNVIIVHADTCDIKAKTPEELRDETITTLQAVKVKVLVRSKKNFVLKDTFYQSKNIIPSLNKKNLLELFLWYFEKRKKCTAQMSSCDVTGGISSRDLTHVKAEQMNIAAQLLVISNFKFSAVLQTFVIKLQDVYF